ncbi:MAG: HAD-IB family hydrolase [Spirochaetia bacterium]|nr:HAD-IB family hydrolase [Spirochaetia bacterium]
MKAEKAAVFYDVDGTLVHTNILHVYIYYALRLPKISEKARKLLMIMLFTPLYVLMEQMSRVIFNKLFYKNYKGIPEERLRILGRELVRDGLMPNVYRDALDRIKQAKKMKLTQVLVSGSLDFVMEPFAKEIGVDHVLSNSLEMKAGVATGALIPPVLPGKERLKLMKDFAARENIDLSKSYVFADSKFDLEMLEAVGFPVAVNPDNKLKKIAAQRGWPIVSFA